MTTKIEVALQAIRDKIRGADLDIRDVPDRVPDNATVFPFVVVWLAGGSYQDKMQGTRTGLHRIYVDLIVDRKDLGRSLERITQLVEQIPALLMNDPALKDYEGVAQIDTINGITYEFRSLIYGDVETIGYRFTINIKIMNQGVE